ncbi:MAG: TonB-dependent receptor [Tannerella sp.]|jgi:TonB-linked SusC/RagA family outer membrane protein|nr:TonB-dependent receptor [Tannerella sp.]
MSGEAASGFSTDKHSVTDTQQAVKITGVVVDEAGEPVIGANVLERGTSNGVITDLDGNFVLSVSSGAVLQISFIGYLTQEVTVGNQTSLRITLREDITTLEEVVVVAYGTQKARSVTGAMSKINTEEMADMPVANITQKMQGKFAGVQILNNSGEPNGNLSIRIRGQASINGGNSPLIVIDGFPTTTGFESLSPDEIESISILKDAASTTLYGSRAANGVILITTKQGKSGKTNISFSAGYGISNVSRQGRPDVMNAREFAQFKKEYYEDAQRYEGSTTPVPEQYANPSAVKDGTDWYDVLLQTGVTQNYNLGLTTGTEVVRSSVNLNYNSMEGTVVNSYADRLSVRSNNELKASERIHFGLNLSGSYINRQVQEGLGNGRNIIHSSFLMDPALKYKNDDGTYPISFTPPGMFGNANYYLVVRDRRNPRKVIRGTATAWGQVEIFDGLKYRLSANGDVGNGSQEVWVPSHVSGGMFSAPPNKAYGSYNTFNYYTWLVENTLNYKKVFLNDHDVDVLVGYTAQNAQSINSTISANDYPDDEVGFFNAATTKVGSGDKSAWAMASWLARLNYEYKSRYILSLSFRRDGCSRFGSEARWADFPSVSGGWVVSEEEFMRGLEKISFAKLRANWGKVGNNNIGNYPSIASVSSNNYVLNGITVPGRQLGSIGNNYLTWETTRSWDIGLDLSLLNDRIFLMYDFYRKTTDGLLYQIDIPFSGGFPNIQSNIGEFRFWGHEFTLQTKNLVGDFRWSTDFNISFDRNKAIRLGTNNTPIGGNNNLNDYNRTTVGMPLGMFYGYVFDGVYMTREEYETQPHHETSTVGTVRMKDLDGDGDVDKDDRTFIGNPNPDFLYGMTNSFEWKNFDASIVFSGSVGNDLMDEAYESTENIDGVFNVRKCVADRWRSEENPGKGEVPRTMSGTTELFRYTNSRWVYDGSYLMVKNITLGYTVPLKRNPYVKSIRFYLTGQNLLTITNYPGMNPEVSLGNASGLSGYGVDYTAYPVSRIYTAGLNITF